MPPENDELPVTPPGDSNEMPSLLPGLMQRLGLEQGQQGVPSQAKLLADLTHPAWYMRAAAVRALGRLGALARQAELLAALDDPHLSVRANAALALSTLGEHAPVERLVQALQSDPEWQVRESAALALANLGYLAREEIRLVALNDPDGNVRETASLALTPFHAAPQADSSIPPEVVSKNHHGSSFLHALPGKPAQNNTLHTYRYREDTMSNRSFSSAPTTSPGPESLPGEPRRTKHPVRRVIGLSITAAVLILMLLSWALLAHTLRTGNHSSSVGASGSSPTATQTTSQRFSGKTLYTYAPSHDSPDYGSLMTVGWSPEGKYISVSGIDLVLLNAANGKVVSTLNSSSFASTWVSWSADGKRLVSSSTEAQVWDVKTGRVLATFIPRSIAASTAHAGNPMAAMSGGNMIYASAFSPDGKYIASAIDGNGIGYDVQIWNAATGAYIRTLQVKPNANYNDYITQVGWSYDGKYIAAASPNNGVIVWDASTGQRAYTKQGAFVMAWAPRSDLLATAVNANGLVQVWEATTGKVQFSFQGQIGDTVYALAWSPNGRYIAASGHNVRVWDASTNKLFGTYTGQGNDPNLYINGLAWSPDSTKIASLGTGMHVTAPHTGYPLDAVKVWEVV